MTMQRRPGGAQHIPRPASYTEHFDTPWSLDAEWSSGELLSRVPERSGPMLPTFPDAKLSAVLLLLADDGRQLRVETDLLVCFTQRRVDR